MLPTPSLLNHRDCSGAGDGNKLLFDFFKYFVCGGEDCACNIPEMYNNLFVCSLMIRIIVLVVMLPRTYPRLNNITVISRETFKTSVLASLILHLERRETAAWVLHPQSYRSLFFVWYIFKGPLFKHWILLHRRGPSSRLIYLILLSFVQKKRAKFITIQFGFIYIFPEYWCF